MTNSVFCCRPMGQAPSLDRQTSLGGGHPSAPPSTPAHPLPAPDQPSYFNSMVGKSSSSQQQKPPAQPVNENSSQPQPPKKEPAKKAEPDKSKKGGGSGLFGSFFGKFLPKPGSGSVVLCCMKVFQKNSAHLLYLPKLLYWLRHKHFYVLISHYT